jgi:AmpD protein
MRVLLADRPSFDSVTGRSTGARQVDSPNFDPRPPGVAPDLIVVHGISLPPDEYGGPWIDDLFLNQLDPTAHPYFADIAGRKVSSHFLIRRSGELVQYVSCHDRAWHAGVSDYMGRSNCNDFSIGIELEGADASAYEPAQYRVLADLILTLCAVFPSLSTERIAGHSDIAPGRKTDPGIAFDWPRLHALLKVRQMYGWPV